MLLGNEKESIKYLIKKFHNSKTVVHRLNKNSPIIVHNIVYCNLRKKSKLLMHVQNY